MLNEKKNKQILQLTTSLILIYSVLLQKKTYTHQNILKSRPTYKPVFIELINLVWAQLKAIRVDNRN